ncbi:MAG: hypothetical protein HUU01_14285, partial [Saprospiraceae bacterium]|nr:hypothetical protein [Saprospiraceae bacterium]
APDKLTLRFKTARPHPLLPNDLVAIRIVPKRIAEAAKTDDFNSGKAMIGTGPYKFKEYVAGDRVVLEGAFHLNNERRRRALRGSGS